MTSKLSELLERFKGVAGVSRVLVLADIRRYVSTRSGRGMLDEIDMLGSSQDCDILLGAGMKGQLYLAVVKRKAQLEGL